MVQPEKDLFEPEIKPKNLSEKCQILALFRLKNPHKFRGRFRLTASFATQSSQHFSLIMRLMLPNTVAIAFDAYLQFS